MVRFPRAILICMSIMLVGAAAFWPRFEFDASFDTLTVKGDPKVADYLGISARFATDEFVIVSFSPSGGVFQPHAITALANLQDDLTTIDGVSALFSILDVPLLDDRQSLTGELLTLRNGASIKRAAGELLDHPLVTNQLISSDGATAALRVTLDSGREFSRLLVERNTLMSRSHLTAPETERLAALNERYQADRLVHAERRTKTIAAIREVRDRHADAGAGYIGGVPMIASDLIDYVRRDVLVFGSLVPLVFVIVLWLFFRRVRWVLLPLGVAAVTLWLLVGLLGAMGTPVTVVSSNFMALIAVIAVSFTVHLVVRQRELLVIDPTADQQTLVADTLRSKVMPTVFTALTDCAAFSTLILVAIPPVADFGWMMSPRRCSRNGRRSGGLSRGYGFAAKRNREHNTWAIFTVCRPDARDCAASPETRVGGHGRCNAVIHRRLVATSRRKSLRRLLQSRLGNSPRALTHRPAPGRHFAV